MIRDARPEDLASIVAIYNAAIPARLATADTEPVSLNSRREWFAQHDPDHHPLLVFESDGQFAGQTAGQDRTTGWLSLEPFYGRPAYAATAEVSVYVAPSSQRQGIAAALLAEALGRAPGLGLHSLLGFIFAHNLPSLALFHKFGFQDWGHLPEVCELDGIRRDVMILGRHVD